MVVNAMGNTWGGKEIPASYINRIEIFRVKIVSCKHQFSAH